MTTLTLDSTPPSPSVDRALLERFIGAGPVLPGDVRAALLALDRPAAIGAMVEVLGSDALADEEAPGEGYAPLHAVALLLELQATEAIEPMLRVLARSDPLGLLRNDLVLALQAMGPPVLEPALAAHARTETDDQRRAVEDVLSALGIQDDRVFHILRRALDREPEFGSGLLAIYGDPTALPDLCAALDACDLEPGAQNSYVRDLVIELADAIEVLGGVLTPDQLRKLDVARVARRGASSTAEGSGPPDDPGAAGVEDDPEDGVDDPEERARLLDLFAASPHAADAPRPSWIGLMLEYAAEYVGVPFADLDDEELDEIVFDIFPRKVTCAPEVAGEVVRSLRAFWSFARDALAHPHAEECLELLGDGAAARLERELADPDNFGLAKSFAMSAGGPGLPGRSAAAPGRAGGSRAERKEKKKLRKQRKKAQRRNRR